jgi:hypothetical protein
MCDAQMIDLGQVSHGMMVGDGQTILPAGSGLEN